MGSTAAGRRRTSGNAAIVAVLESVPSRPLPLSASVYARVRSLSGMRRAKSPPCAETGPLATVFPRSSTRAYENAPNPLTSYGTRTDAPATATPGAARSCTLGWSAPATNGSETPTASPASAAAYGNALGSETGARV